MKKQIPTLEMDMIFTVTHNNFKRYYQLMDIAIWTETQKILTIDIMEIKLPYLPTKEEIKYFKSQIKKSKFTLVHKEPFLVKFKNETQPYLPTCYFRYNYPKEFSQTYFNKMMSTR